jgi:protein-tyrosine phosphatase
MVRHVQQKTVGTVNGNGRYLLVEFPFQSIPPGAVEELFKLKTTGIIPIITHPERHPVYQHNPDELSGLVQMGCLVQVTAMSVTGEFGHDAMTCAHTLLERRMVHVIATDSHGPGYRPPKLSDAVDVAAHILGNRKEAEMMVTDTPTAIVAGEPVDTARVTKAAKRKWWKIWSNS